VLCMLSLGHSSCLLTLTNLCSGVTFVKASLHKIMKNNTIENKGALTKEEQANSAEKRLCPKDVAGFWNVFK
jgi:hypothetical protein